MDYDTRINRLENAIQWLESARSVALYCPASIHSNFWDTSQSKDAAEETFNQLDSFLLHYQTAYSDSLEALRARKEQLYQTKIELFNYYTRELMGLSAEDRANYLNKANIDQSVKKMLGG